MNCWQRHVGSPASCWRDDGGSALRDKINWAFPGSARSPSLHNIIMIITTSSFGTPTSLFDLPLIDTLSPRMSLPLSTAAFSRYAPFFYCVHWHPFITHGSTNRQPMCIDILDDDSLLNVFYHCRPPVALVEADGDRINPFDGRWECEYWWYKLAWVCRRWRCLILASPSYLGVSLVCRPGTPVADMLAHSPLSAHHRPQFRAWNERCRS